ncbi:MAG TPA: YncE family protein [Myxococcales bacterium]
MQRKAHLTANPARGWTMPGLLAAVALAIAGCASAARHLVRPPLESEGELIVELQPLPSRQAPQSDVSSVAAAGGGGDRPLELLLGRIAGEPVQTQRTLARGRLAPGAYDGLVVVLRGRGGEPATIRVEAPFSIARRHATVLLLSARLPAAAAAGDEDDADGPRVPALTAAVAQRPVPAALGFCSSASRSEVAGFDKALREVATVLPAGRAPWGVAVDGFSNRAYVALADEDQVAIFDTGTGEEQNRIRLNVGDQPREIGLTPDRRTLVTANAGSNSVSILDTAAMTEIGRIAVGVEPSTVLVDRRGQRAYVFNLGSNSFSVIDLANRMLVATIGTDEQPLRGQIDRSGTRLYVASARSPVLTVYSLSDFSVQNRVHIGLGTSGIKVDSASDLIFVAKARERRLLVYDPLALIPVDRVEAAEGATYFAIDDAQNALFALSPEGNTVSVVDLASRRLVARFDVGEDARAISLNGERN